MMNINSLTIPACFKSMVTWLREIWSILDAIKARSSPEVPRLYDVADGANEAVGTPAGNLAAGFKLLNNTSTVVDQTESINTGLKVTRFALSCVEL